MAFKRTTLNPFSVFLSAILMAGGSIASALPAADYYVSTLGNDTTGNGSVNSHWASLEYACETVTMSGKTIYVLPGNYYSQRMIPFSLGVSAFGAGITTKIYSSYNDSAVGQEYRWLNFVSNSEGVNGNQSLSYIWFDGRSLSAYHGGYCRGRSNVSIHHCKFTDFAKSGFTFSGIGNEIDGPPTVYATGNSFHNNTVINCADAQVVNPFNGAGNLQVGGQDGMLIYNNIITATARVSGANNPNGYCIKFYRQGNIKNCKIYGNALSRMAKKPDGSFDFCIEMWYLLGGNEIYDNVSTGCFDLAYCDKGASTFSVAVYRNTIGPTTPSTINAPETGVNIEASSSHIPATDVLIYRNYFRNLKRSLLIFVHGTGVVDRVNFYNNIMYKSGGYAGYSLGTTAAQINNINIINNTSYIIPSESNVQPNNGYDCHEIRCNCVHTNFVFRNNIMQGAQRSAIFMWDGKAGASMTGMSFENNITYNNGNNSIGYDGTNTSSIVTVTIANNSTANPNLVLTPNAIQPDNFDIKLPSSFNGIANSLSVEDYLGVTRASPPDIGAFEYV